MFSGMDDSTLAVIGGLFLILTLGAYVVESGSSLIRTGKKISFDRTLKLLGMVSFVIWFCIGFTLACWAVSTIYWRSIETVYGLFASR